MTTAIAAPAETAAAGERSVPAGAPTALEALGLIGLVAVGAVSRAHGFTNLDLWFDDAWAAMPARVGLHSAVHMVTTAPGYGLALRSWIRIDPTTTWWAQLPAFVLGLLAIPAVYALVRWLRHPRWVAFGAAAVVAAGPLAIQYATRVKEYPFDLLAACAVLALAERVRRDPTTGRLAALACGSVLLFGASAGLAPVVAGAWLAVAIAVIGRRDRRTALVGALVATAAGAGVVWAVFLRGLPGVLTTNWRRRGFLVDYRSLGLAERSISLVFGGFVHAALAYPVPVSFFRAGNDVHDAGATVVGIVVLAGAILVPVVASSRARRVSPELAAALSLLVALALAFADRVPLGDGRTDEVLYPALLVCLAAVTTKAAVLARRAMGDDGARRVVAVAVGAALLAGSVVFALAHRAVYPTISLRGVEARLRSLERPGDVVFVDTFNSFGWCYYGLSACRVQVGGRPVWPQGFRPVAEVPATTFIAEHYATPLPELIGAQASAHRIWYVGYTLGTYDVAANPAAYNVPVRTIMLRSLEALGWRVAPYSARTAIFSVHAYAELLVHSGPHHR
jgi:hypothetical protein